jgi:hypothetical protein
MTDLDIRLAEARERLREEMKANNPGIESFSRLILWGEGFDACAVIVRKVVAERDAEIVKWRTWATEMPDYGWDIDDRDSPLWRWFDDMPKDEQHD